MKQDVAKAGNLLVIIIVFAGLAGLLLTGCSGKKAVTEKNGEYTAEAVAECEIPEEDISYPVCVSVTADKDGVIIRVEDAGTSIPDGKDGKFKQAQALFDELVGKTAEDIPDVDAVSGATCSSKAILEAVQKAMQDIDKIK